MHFGETIKCHRKENGWTLKELSERCGLSVAQLSKLENEKSSASIDSLRKLANVFRIPLSSITLTESEQKLSPVLDGEGFIVRWCRRGDDNVTVRYLTLNREARMQPMIVTIPAGMDTGASKSHPGDEFFYVLDGRVRFFYGGEAFDVKRGDFIYYNGLFQHHWQNMSDSEARIMTCNDPPVM